MAKRKAKDLADIHTDKPRRSSRRVSTQNEEATETGKKAQKANNDDEANGVVEEVLTEAVGASPSSDHSGWPQ